MILTFLGTSSGAPSPTRNVSGVGLFFTERGKWWLFDCGEGTQHQIMRSTLRISQLEKIFITHLHGDHLYGLIGLLASRSLRGGELNPVTIYGPAGVKQYFDAVMRISPVHLQYPVHFEVMQAGIHLMEDGWVVECAEVAHRVPALAYAVQEPVQPGAFDAERAKALGIPPGPVYGRLKRGETVVLEDGRMIDGRELVGPELPGRRVVISGDTTPCPSLTALARHADVLVHEATYAHDHLELALRSGHSTALQAAQTAREAGVHQLILTHFSPRYENVEEEGGVARLEEEARTVFPPSVAAYDFMQVVVKKRKATRSI